MSSHSQGNEPLPLEVRFVSFFAWIPSVFLTASVSTVSFHPNVMGDKMKGNLPLFNSETFQLWSTLKYRLINKHNSLLKPWGSLFSFLTAEKAAVKIAGPRRCTLSVEELQGVGLHSRRTACGLSGEQSVFIWVVANSDVLSDSTVPLASAMQLLVFLSQTVSDPLKRKEKEWLTGWPYSYTNTFRDWRNLL